MLGGFALQSAFSALWALRHLLVTAVHQDSNCPYCTVLPVPAILSCFLILSFILKSWFLVLDHSGTASSHYYFCLLLVMGGDGCL